MVIVLALQMACGDAESELPLAELPFGDSRWSQVSWAHLDTLAVVGSGPTWSEPPFYRVSDAVLDNERNIVFLANGGDGELMQYDIGSGQIRRIGRRGAGPGEFRRPLWMEPYGPDSLLVYDRDLTRFSIFSRSGRFGRTFRVSGTGLGGKQAEAMTRMGTGTWVAIQSGLPRVLLVPETPPGTKERDTLTVLAIDDEGKVLDTIARVPHALWERLPDPTSFNIRRDEDAAGAMIAGGGGRLFVAVFDDSLEVFAYNPAGGDLRAPSRHPVALAGVPRHGVRQVFASREGSLWIASSVSAGDSTVFRVFGESSDTWVRAGTLTLHGTVRILDASEDRVVFLHLDSLRGETVVVARASGNLPQQADVNVDTLQYQWDRQSYDTIPFVRPTVLLVTSWGEVWVTDTGERAVYRWSTKGDELSRVGGRGSGPGEFIRPGYMIEMKADSVGVWDRQLQRMSFFGRGGEFLSMREIPLSVSAHGFLTSVSLRGDTALVMAVTYPSSIEPSPRDNQAVLWRFCGTDLRPDSLFAVQGTSMMISRRDGMSTRFLAPFRGRGYAFFPDDGNILVGHGEDNSLSVLSNQGHQVRQIELDLPLLPITRMDRESFSDSLRIALEENIRRSGAGPTDRSTLRVWNRRIVRNLEFPDSHPRYTDAFQDAAGLLWLRTATQSDAEYVEWRAYSHITGDHLRSVFLPSDGSFLNTRTDGSAFFVTQADSLGQSRLVKYGR